MKVLPFLSMAVLAVVMPASAQQDVNINADAILRELEALEQKQSQTLEGARRSAINTLRQGAAGGSAASSLYADAVQATQFAGRRDRVSAFAEWRKNNADLLRSSEFQGALALHLHYLLMTMERKTSDDPGAFAQPSYDYVVELIRTHAAVDKLDNVPNPLRDALDKPVNESIFSRWLSLGQWLYRGDDWEASPGNVGGILEKNVRRAWRESQNSRLIDSHELLLKFEADRVATGRLAHEAETFNNQRRPRILFARANDVAALGMTNRAITEILALVRAHPQHPDFGNWLKRIRELLPSQTPEATTPPEEAPTEAPADAS